jgi:uncharacterized protein
LYTRLLAILLLAIAAMPVYAAEVPSLYTAQVPFDKSADDGREVAYRAALDVVLLKVSGSDLAGDPEKVELLFPDPATYVVQFRPGEQDTLWVSFDGRAIERTLRQAGQTVWGGDRPLTIVWLAVDWGQGQREIIGSDDQDRSGDASRSIDRNRLLRERVLDITDRRGLPVVFPLLDVADLQQVSFSDIWGGFDDAVLEASKRYDANSILIGRVRVNSHQPDNWRYYLGGQERALTGEPEYVIGQVADILADEFAIRGNARVEAVDLTIGGIESVDAYGAVQSMLAHINVVDSFAIVEVSGDTIRYRVEATGGAPSLGRALRFNGLTEQNDSDEAQPPADSDEARLSFFYSP